jgi:hypothetical protein
VTFYNLFVASKVKKRKKRRKNFFVGIVKATNGKSKIRIRICNLVVRISIKTSGIRNTALYEEKIDQAIFSVSVRQAWRLTDHSNGAAV